jgi:hypothetical protein
MRTKQSLEFRPSLTQHFFASAACWLLHRGAGRQSGHSQVMILHEPRLHFRRNPWSC